jgi:DUF2934 family protein
MNATSVAQATFSTHEREIKMTDGTGQQPPEDDAFRDAVQRTAYFLWEQDGRPHGRDEEYYLRALEKHRRERKYDAWLEDNGPEDG